MAEIPVTGPCDEGEKFRRRAEQLAAESFTRLKRLEDWQPTVDTRLKDLLLLHNQAAADRGEVRAIVAATQGNVERVERQVRSAVSTLEKVESSVSKMTDSSRSRKMWWSRVGSTVVGGAGLAIVLLILQMLFHWPLSGHVEAAPQTQAQTK